MAGSKDSALFEGRAHNFSVLQNSSDEEDAGKKQGTNEPLSAYASAMPVAASVMGTEGDTDGFETFTVVRKGNKSAGKTSGPHSASKPQAGGVLATGARPAGTSIKSPFPKDLIRPTAENSIELYDFASTIRTNDLRKILAAFDGHYRLKWHNDTSCFVVFDDNSLGIASSG